MWVICIFFPHWNELHFISNLKCALRSCLCPVCRFCVSKRFRRTTITNICIQPCLRGVGHLRQWNSHVWVYYDKDITNIVLMLSPQATPVCTSGVRGPRQMAVLLAIVEVASRRYRSPCWSSSGLRRSCWTGITWALFCCFGPWSPGGHRWRRWAHPSAWPTPISSTTPGGVMWSWLS